MKRRRKKRRDLLGKLLLLRRSISKGNTLGNVTLETFHSGGQEFLLGIVDVGEWVLSFVGSVGLFDC